jgi:hypothetical protein
VSANPPDGSPGASPARGEAPDPVLQAYLKDVDRSLIRKNLALSVEQRFLQLMQLQAFAAELRRAAQRAERR